MLAIFLFAVAPTSVAADVAQVLEGNKAGLTALERALSQSPEDPALRAVVGTAALFLGDHSRARIALADLPEWALYRAMAEAEGPGGIARARSTLADAAKNADAPAGVLFLASLAFAQAGQSDRADQMLVRAAGRAANALDESFAPDPAVALARAAVLASPGEEIEIARALLRAGRSQEAKRIAEKAETKDATSARRIAVAATLDPRKRLEQIELLLRAAPDDDRARIERVEANIELRDFAAARRALDLVPAVEGEDRARFLRAKVRVLLETQGDVRECVETAESAAAADPKSNVALGLLVRALIAAKSWDRALAYVLSLHARHPKDVDPFLFMAEIAEGKGELAKAKTMRLRSDAFHLERDRADREIERRERVISAVRDAEAGLSITALEVVRMEQPLLALPIDLATMRHGTPGFKRAARDRILNACKGDFAAFLKARDGFLRLRVPLSLYGEATRIERGLSAADPARCTEIPQRAR